MTQENELRSNDKAISTSIAVIGMSCIFPKADNLHEYWTNIKNGADSITEVPPTHWQKEDYFDNDPNSPDHTYTTRGGFINPVDFNPLEFGITPNAVEATDTSQLLGLVTAKRALQDAGYWESKEFDRNKTSVILGVTGTLELVIPLGARLSHPAWRRALKDAGVDDKVANDVVERISDSYVGWQENSFPGLLGNVAAGRIANRLDLRGTNCVVDAACASSLSALHMAMLELTCGRSDMVITGGVDTFNDIFMFMCFSKTHVLSQTGDARPFAQNSDGTILGEGIGMVVLKRLEDAERDNDNIYAVIRGVGTSSDGKGNAVYVPSRVGQARAVRNAYEQAGVTPDTIGLVEAHGTGTKVGDASELGALTDVYREQRNAGTWCALGSVKSQIGHTKAAAGIAGLIKVIMALRNKTLPPSIKIDSPIDELAKDETPFYVNAKSQPWLANGAPRRAAVSAFGFGGSNFHCVLEEYEQEKSAIDWDANIEIVPFGAKDIHELKNRLRSFASGFSIKNIAVTAAESRAGFSIEQACRLIMVIENGKTDVNRSINNALDMLEKQPDKKSWSAPGGVYFSQNTEKGKLGIVFSGQGSQYPGMQRDLACQFPQMQKTLTDANTVFSDGAQAEESQILSNYIYPPRSFDAETTKNNEERLNITNISQPAIGAVSLGMFDTLRYFGVKPDALAGHSFGELTALCAASAFDPQTFYKLAKVRGKLMSECNDPEGAMMAVWSDEARLTEMIEKENLNLVVANKNSPEQTVISGPLEMIKKIGDVFAGMNIRRKHLPVSMASHSPLMAKAVEKFSAELRDANFTTPNTPVFANKTAQQYPYDAEMARKALAEQLVSPVEFIKQIKNMSEFGVTTFLEVGPGNKIAGLVDAIMDGSEHDAFSMDASSGANSGIVDLASTLARLATLGYDVDLTKWNEGAARLNVTDKTDKKPSIALPICGANYVKPKEKRPPKPITKIAAAESKPNINESAAINKPAKQQASTPVTGIAKSRASANKPADMNRPAKLPASAPVAGKTESTSNINAATNMSQPDKLQAPKISNVDKASINEMFRITTENMKTLQSMQEQTAKLHQQFLVNQNNSQKTLSDLIDQQRRLFGMPGTSAQNEPLRAVQQESIVNNALNVAPKPIQPQKVETPQTQPQHIVETRAPQQTENVVQKSEPVVDAKAQPAPQKPKPQPAAKTNLVEKERIGKVLLAVVSEKTGYPSEMLDLDMSLDSDLGIDSIKRVEIMSALQDQLPNAPEVKPEHMGTLSTLRKIIDFISVSTGEADAPEVAKPDIHKPADKMESTDPAAGKNTEQVQEILLKVVSEKTGYPSEMLDLDMSLDSDLGIDSIKRVEIMSALQDQLPNAPEVKPEHMGTLGTLRKIIDFISVSTEETKAPDIQRPTEKIEATTAHAGKNTEQVQEILLKVVAEKTGYPSEMLDLDMSLDSDLGIDSIKRVEILSAMQEQMPNAPEVKPEHMGTLGTLRKIIDFISVPDSGETQTAAIQEPAEPRIESSAQNLAPDNGFDKTLDALLDTVAEKTGYPAEMIDINMNLDADLGIDSIKRVEILSALQDKLPNAPEVKPEHMGTLNTLKQIAEFLTASPDSAATDVEQAIEPTEKTQPAVATEIKDDIKPEINEEIENAPEEGVTAIERRVLCPVGLNGNDQDNAFSLRDGAEIWVTNDSTNLSAEITLKLRQLGYQPVLIPITEAGSNRKSDDLAGLIIVAPADPVDEGFLKSAFKLLQVAAVGLRNSGKNGGALFATVTRMDGEFGLNGLMPKSYPISGGLAGLSKTARHEWPEVHCKALDVSSNLENNKQTALTIVNELFIDNLIEVGISKTGRNALELRHQDILDSDVVSQINRKDVIIVAGGARGVTAKVSVALAKEFKPLLILLGRSKYPEDEPAWAATQTDEAGLKKAIIQNAGKQILPRQVEEQYKTLIANREILNNIAEMEEAGAQVIYQSVDVRDADSVESTIANIRSKFGTINGLIHGAGVLADRLIEEKTEEQFDSVYATKVTGLLNLLNVLENDDLKCIALFSSFTGRYGRIGQVDYAVANEALNKIAQQQSRMRPACRVVSVNWGPWDGGMVTPSLKKIFKNENVELIEPDAGAEYLVREMLTKADGPVEVVVMGRNGSQNRTESAGVSVKSDKNLAFEIALNVKAHPFLLSHVIDSRAVLPMAMMIEWSAQAALHENPGLLFYGFDDMRMLKGVTLEQSETINLQFLTGKAVRNEEGFYCAPVELKSIGANNAQILHSSTQIILVDKILGNSLTKRADVYGEYNRESNTIYEEILFHGKDFHGIEQVENCGENGISAIVKSAPTPDKWINTPLRNKWLTDPLAVDCSFQLMILWCFDKYQDGSLPCFAGKYRQYKRTMPIDGTRVVINVNKSDSKSATADIDFIDNKGSLVARLEDYESIISPSLNSSFRRNVLS